MALLYTLNLYTPLALAAVFFLSLIYSFLQPASPRIQRTFRQRRNLITFTSLVVTFLFCIVAVQKFQPITNFSESAYIHALSQILYQATLSLTLSTIPNTSPVVFLGPWNLLFISETALLVLSIVKGDLRDGRPIALSAVICGLLFGLALFVDTIFLFPKDSGDPLEREPLLMADDYISTPSVASAASSTRGSTCAESAQTEQDPDFGYSSDSDGSDDDEEELRATRDQKILQDGGWIRYLASFKVFLPFTIPSNDLRLQIYATILLASTIAQRGLHILHPYLLGSIIDTLTKHHVIPWDRIILWVIVDALARDSFGLEGLNDILLERLSAWSRQKITVHAFDKIMGLSMDFHDRKDSGETIKAIEQATSISELFKVLVFEIVPCFFDVFIAVWYVNYLLDVYAMLVVIAVGIGFTFSTIWMSNSSAATRRVQSAKDREETKVLFETVSNWPIVSFFNRKAYETKRLERVAKAAADANVKNNDRYIGMFACQEACERIGLIAVSIVAAYRISIGASTVGDFVALESYWTTITMPLYIVSHSYRSISSNMIDAERLLQLFATKVTVQDKPSAQTLKFDDGNIEFSNVSFAYEARTANVLNDLTFSVKAGQTVAFVGSSGAGKSTIAKLSMRSYDVNTGSIRISGQDIRDVTQESLRNIFGFVPQESVLFNTTVLENVRYGRLEASDEEIFAACRAACIHDKIISLPHGYLTRVGEKGAKLSGGERQRIAIARVILRDPKIVFLDEATSALDSQTEAKVQRALKSLMKGRTACIIAHRLSTITDADVIFVIESGRVLESGTHDQLLESRGAYYGLWSKQTAMQDGAKVTEV